MSSKIILKADETFLKTMKDDLTVKFKYPDNGGYSTQANWGESNDARAKLIKNKIIEIDTAYNEGRIESTTLKRMEKVHTGLWRLHNFVNMSRKMGREIHDVFCPLHMWQFHRQAEYIIDSI